MNAEVVRYGPLSPAGRGDRHRQGVERLAGDVEIVAFDNDLLARRVGHHHRGDHVGHRLGPNRADLVRRMAKPDLVDFGARPHGPDHHRHVVDLAFAVSNVGEQHGPAIRLGDAAAELPAHQRMQFGVLVDRDIDAQQEPGAIQRVQLIMQVHVGSGWPREALVGQAIDPFFRRGGRGPMAPVYMAPVCKASGLHGIVCA